MSSRYANFTIPLSLALTLCAGSASASDPIAVAEGEAFGLRAEITELKRTGGNTVTLRFVLVNETGNDLNTRVDIFGGTADLRQVHLIDDEGMKKYLPVMDSQNNCVCSSGLPPSLRDGQSLNLWARFPAPPPEVTTVSLMLPRFIPTEVPVSD